MAADHAGNGRGDAAGGTGTTAGSDRPLPDGPISLVILGGSGDLTSRLLLPGLASLLTARGGVDLRLIGSSTSDWADERWQDLVRTSLEKDDVPASVTEDIVVAARWVQADSTTADGMRAVLDAAGDADATILYFAVPPAIAENGVRALAELDSLPDGLRLALEKPFGNDQDSAHDLNRLLLGLLPEEQIFRVDHFLGESMVLNMITLRTANRLLEGAWSSEDVASVDIVYDEEIALEGRAGYYDRAGALVDMLQSHLLEVLAILAMETPAAIGHQEVHDGIAGVLRATRVRGGDPVASSRRSRYLAGTSLGRQVPDYTAEDGVDPSRGTETLAEVTLEVDTPRWHGIPFRLRSGKALHPPRHEVVLTFREPRFRPAGLTPSDEPDRLVITLSPEKIALGLSVDGADTPFRAARSLLEAELGGGEIEPYGEVLAGLLAGDPLLSVRGDVAEECWRILDPVLEAWRKDQVPLQEYPAGSRGPEADPADRDDSKEV